MYKKYDFHLSQLKKYPDSFFGGGQGLNPGPCIYYALSLPTELCSDKISKFYVYCHERHFFAAVTVFRRDFYSLCKNGNVGYLYLFAVAFFSATDRFLKPCNLVSKTNKISEWFLNSINQYSSLHTYPKRLICLTIFNFKNYFKI